MRRPRRCDADEIGNLIRFRQKFGARASTVFHKCYTFYAFAKFPLAPRAAWPQPSRGAYVQAPPYLAPPISDSPIIPSLSRTGRRRSPEPCSQRSPLDCSRSSSAHTTHARQHLCLHQLAPPLILLINGEGSSSLSIDHRGTRKACDSISLSLPPPIGEHTKKKTASRGGDPA